ncbi:tRNA dihydrouridine synthase [Legionella dresdenensis]|uniref:tRNA-dihydrouridine synthase n=1 Tax=Legionella dresdenensis TaxID=450200 RepID=A0ABV8CHK8_9GAMM
MQSFLNTSFKIGTLTLANRLIQGPLAGYSCAPFRQLFTLFTPPAYCVSEMISAQDIISRHHPDGRYLYRSPEEHLLCYQMAGTDPVIMAEAAQILQRLGADLIDINCGCPKSKIRKKGAGSALLQQPERLLAIVKAVRNVLSCPLTVKIRLQDSAGNQALAQAIEQAGADALIVHGRRWTDDYDIPCNYQQIAEIRQVVNIPVIANGDLATSNDINAVINQTGCDGYMISRAGTGKPWLYAQLLNNTHNAVSLQELGELFLTHLQNLQQLESEHQAVLQSRSLFRYYFKSYCDEQVFARFCRANNMIEIAGIIKALTE